ncbi:MAG: DHH family phosphoesterase [Oscillospiraceae bacterium]|nr:DHH family phosphoesterase [Oscillospiraceae bacterium]
MSQRIHVAEAAAFFREHDRFLIFTHNTPDADTIGSACALVRALRKLGKQADAFNREGVPARLAFLQPETVFQPELPDLEGRTPISVDVASPRMLSMPESAFTFALAIDHHEISTVPCEKLYLEESFPAAGEMVYLLLKELGVPMDTDIATALYAAISSDSGGFRFSSTRPDTMRNAAELMETGIDFAKINRLLFDTKQPAEVAIERLGYEKLELHYDGRFALVAVTQEDLSSAGATDQDCEQLKHLPRQIAGVQVSAVIRPKGAEIKCSLRSNEEINVAALAAEFGGGGHFHAAGFSVPGSTVDAVKQTLLEKIEDKLL